MKKRYEPRFIAGPHAQEEWIFADKGNLWMSYLPLFPFQFAFA